MFAALIIPLVILILDLLTLFQVQYGLHRFVDGQRELRT